jgi:hypothetical protein
MHDVVDFSRYLYDVASIGKNILAYIRVHCITESIARTSSSEGSESKKSRRSSLMSAINDKESTRSQRRMVSSRYEDRRNCMTANTELFTLMLLTAKTLNDS